MGFPNCKKVDLIKVLSKLNAFSERVNQCLALAERSHINQKREDGTPYLEEHIYPVTMEVIEYYLNEELPLSETTICIALLHDSLEDCKDLDIITIVEIAGNIIANGVRTVTKPEYENFDGESIGEKKHNMNVFYYEQILKSDDEVIIVKLSDRLNNLKCLMKTRESIKLHRYIRDTEEHILPISLERSKYFHERLLREIASIRGSERWREISVDEGV